MWARLVKATPILIGLVAVAALPTDTGSSEWPRLALRGYDPVAYFVAGRPTRGNPEYVYAWRDTMYQFATQTHREIFIAQPNRYVPQFTGYCVLGMMQGFKVDADPEAWAIVDGKLYLTYNMTARETLLADPLTTIALAEANWKTLAH